MKVCTDACVFGAWADVSGIKRILDIGTGTGLLSLMAAERNREAAIDAVDIDKNAFQQAAQNFASSPYSARLSASHSPIQEFFPGRLYDCIISNPPFFQNDLKSPDAKINIAHHAGTMNFEDLLLAVSRLLAPDGVFHVLLPVAESEVYEAYCRKENKVLIKELLLVHKPGYPHFRRMMSWQRKAAKTLSSTGRSSEELFIYQKNGKDYHPRFKDYLKAFYLGF